MSALQVLLGILGAVLIALLVELRRRLRPPSTRHVGDQLKLSPDGKYWWDGQEWQPIGPAPTSAPSPPRTP